MSTRRVTGTMLRQQLRTFRTQEEVTLTTADKILIAAEVLKREHASRSRKPMCFNDADLIHICLTLFPEYGGTDRDLYLRGKLPSTIPMIRPTLIRDHLFGREAPLKPWMLYNKKDEAYQLKSSGSIYVHRLLSSANKLPEKPGSGSRPSTAPKPTNAPKLVPTTPSNAPPPNPAPAAIPDPPPEPPPMAATPANDSTSSVQMQPTRENLRTFGAIHRRYLNLIDKLEKLDCIKRPHSPLSTDYGQLLMMINYHREPSDRLLGLDFVTEAVKKAKEYAVLELAVNGKLKSLQSLETRQRALDLLLQHVGAIFARVPRAVPPRQLYQKTGPLQQATAG